MSLPPENRPKQKPLRKIESSGDIILVDKSYFKSKTLKPISKGEIEEHMHNTIITHERILDKSSSPAKITRRMQQIKPIVQPDTYSSTTDSDLIEEYRQRQLLYIKEVDNQNSEKGKSFFFLEFIRDIFKDIQANHPHKLYPELEKYITSYKTVLIRGRIDAFLGNLIFEFESNLKRYRENCELQLRKYTAILWNNKGKVNYLCVATDGLQFLIFRPRSTVTQDFTENNIKLELVDTFNIRTEDPITIYKRLDRYILYRTLISPSAKDIVQDFGHKSLVLSDCMSLLDEAWKNIKNECITIYNEWSKYLSIVYGSDVQDEQLFLRHTYLATLAKLMVFSFYQENTIPTSHSIINLILRGDVFREWNIENFLVEDFFSWIVRSEAYKYGIQIALRILDGLDRYDLTKLNEDVLKELYQQLIDPSERRYLGEFYTPDWLAEMMIREVVTDVHVRILDPACGSGTFLASTIRYKLSLMTGMDESEKIDLIIHTVNGIDVHPLAVLISKANYLMAIGDVLKQKKGVLIIPVYMADSIIFPVPTRSVARYRSDAQEELLYHYRIDSQNELVFPSSLVDAESADSILDNIKEFADRKLTDHTLSDRVLLDNLEKRYGLTADHFEIIIETVNTLINLIRKGKDSIYPFILKNIYKPSIIGKFDVVIGNPPWLSYRYIRSQQRQSEIKKLIIQTYNLLNSAAENLMTQMEMATLFFVRNADLYLGKTGNIAFVLPRGVFTGDQHKNFRENHFSLELGFSLLYDLEKNRREKVSPLFSVETCVVFAKKGISTTYPIPTRLMNGRLPKKNSTFKDILQLVDSKNFKITNHETVLTKIGGRTSWNYEDEIKINSTKSPYMTRFKNGAKIYPRMFWLVDPVPHKVFGLDVKEPLMQSSKRSLLMAKKEYRGTSLKGKVEEHYLYATLLGSDIFPFCHLNPRIVVLPVDSSGHSFRVIEKDEVQAKGDKNMYQWLSQAENSWKKVRKEKSSTMTIYKLLNRSGGVTIQLPEAEYVVVYTAAGRDNVASCVLKTKEVTSTSVNGNRIMLHGFIADHLCYLYYPKSQKEAYYLAAIINSDFTFSLLKRIKSARHIHKKIWELPIPEFNHGDSKHLELSQIAESCVATSKAVLYEEVNKLPSFDSLTTWTVGKIRKIIKNALEQDVKRINTLVASLLKR